MRPIPVAAATLIAREYGYDQVIIYVRKIGEDPEPHGEHMTTYGVTKIHCGIAAKVGRYMQDRMGWNKADV